MFRHCRRLCPAAISAYPLRHVRARPSYRIHVGLLGLSTSSSQPKPPGSVSGSGASASSAWSNSLRKFFRNENGEDSHKKRPNKPKRAKVVDIEPAVASASTKADDGDRLLSWLERAEDEFPPDIASDRRRLTLEASRRIVRIAADRVLQLHAVALLTMSASAVLGIAAAEASLLTAEIPFFESVDAGRFVARYAVEQLLPSCVSKTQDAKLVATAMGIDPAQLLRQLDPVASAADASALLRIQMLASCRCMAAGFMLLAQLVRVGTIGAAAARSYEDRVRVGREPPLLSGQGQGPAGDDKCRGLIVRLCGRGSDVTATSLRRMGRHLFPVFEEPDRVHHLVAQHSDGGRVPVFWRVRPGRYGASYSWQGFPVDARCLIRTSTGRKVLLLEADATNADDPLALGDQALDLTIDDASQGFQRVMELFRSSSNGDAVLPPFRTLRVYLGNSLETAMSGGGHEYTLRHRVRYAREVDVLIDSRAPVLQEILRWCDCVAGTDRVVLFQTSSRQYFLSLQLIMQRYGYRICDPLDWKLADQLSYDQDQDPEVEIGDGTETADPDAAYREYESLLQILMEDRMEDIPHADAGEDAEAAEVRLKKATRDRKRGIMKLSRLPRLVYYGKTAETVNAVEALLNAGAVDVTNCCALLDKEEGTQVLTTILNEKTDMIQRGPMEWRGKNNAPLRDGGHEQDEPSPPTHGLHIISSSTIYDDLFRQVRQWTRMGYSAADIQKELDTRYEETLKQSQEVHETVAEVTAEEEATDAMVPVKEKPSEEAEGSTSTDDSLEIEKKS